MLTRIVDARMVDLKNSSVSQAVYIKAVEESVSTSEKKELVKKDAKGRRIFNANVLNKSMFPNVFHTVLFPENEELVEMFREIVEENEGKEENERDYPMIHLCKENVSIDDIGGSEYIMRYTHDDEDGNFQTGDVILDDDGNVKIFDQITVVLLCDDDDKPTENSVRKARNRYKQNMKFDDEFGFAVWQSYDEYLEEEAEKAEKEARKRGNNNDGGSEFADRANARNNGRQTKAGNNRVR